MTEKLTSYLDSFHHESENLNVTVTVEGGECEECGRGGQQFYVSGGPGPARKMCESCARKLVSDK